MLALGPALTFSVPHYSSPVSSSCPPGACSCPAVVLWPLLQTLSSCCHPFLLLLSFSRPPVVPLLACCWCPEGSMAARRHDTAKRNQSVQCEKAIACLVGKSRQARRPQYRCMATWQPHTPPIIVLSFSCLLFLFSFCSPLGLLLLSFWRSPVTVYPSFVLLVCSCCFPSPHPFVLCRCPPHA